jgi:hypothetical protein
VPSTPQQLRTRARFETLIGLGAPVFDLVLAVGERVSRIAGRNDDYVPIRAASERLELTPARRRPQRPEGEPIRR